MIIILGAGGFLGYSLAYELNSLDYNYTTVSRSFQWKPFTSENRFLCPVSSVKTYSQNFTKDSAVIYMAGSTDLALAESDDVSDLEKHENEMRMFFAGLSDGVHLPSKFIFLVPQELFMEMHKVLLLLKPAPCDLSLLTVEEMLL